MLATASNCEYVQLILMSRLSTRGCFRQQFHSFHPSNGLYTAVATGIKSPTRLDTDGSHVREVVKRTGDKCFSRTDEVRAVRDGSKVTFGEQRGWFRLLLAVWKPSGWKRKVPVCSKYDKHAVTRQPGHLPQALA